MAFKIDSINPKTTAVIVVDMQKDFSCEGFPMYAKMAGDTMPKKDNSDAEIKNPDIVKKTTILFLSRNGSAVLFSSLHAKIPSGVCYRQQTYLTG